MNAVWQERLDALRRSIQQALFAAVSHEEPASFYKPVRYTLEGGGKRIRPVLVLLASEAVGGTTLAAMDCAVAVELMHNFTLVHDDIMDKDDVRRGRPTVHVAWDADVAILTGDGLIALAYRQLFRTPTPRLRELGEVFSEGIIEVCEGQALDKDFEERSTVSMDEYLRMIGKKTARLFSVSCHLGALVGGGSVAQVEALTDFGWNLGLAFQVQDDLLDVLSSQAVSGKPQGSDIRQRKKTFLFVQALSTATASKRCWLLRLYSQPVLGEADVERISSFFAEVGAVSAAQQMVDRYLHEALASLQKLPPSRARDYLRDLTEQLSGREV